MTKTNSVHIQSIGTRPATTAAELQIGDVRIYNQGTTATVVDIEEASPAFLFVTTDHGTAGRITRKVRKTTLVAVVA